MSMGRIHPPRRPGLVSRLLLWIAGKQSGGTVPEPFAVQAHHPRLMKGYGAFEWAFMHSHRAPKKLKLLIELKAAALCGCEWCMDYASSLTANVGIGEAELRDLPCFRESEAFTDEEKLVLEYAECISATPVAVPDELFEQLRRRFDEAQLIELTYAAAIENMRARFNWALGIRPQGYSGGAFCVRPEVAGPSNLADLTDGGVADRDGER